MIEGLKRNISDCTPIDIPTFYAFRTKNLQWECKEAKEAGQAAKVCEILRETTSLQE